MLEHGVSQGEMSCAHVVVFPFTHNRIAREVNVRGPNQPQTHPASKMRSCQNTCTRAQSLAEQLAKSQSTNQVKALAAARQLSFELAKTFANQPASDLAKELFGKWETVRRQNTDGRMTHHAHTPEQTAVSASDNDRDNEHLPTKNMGPEETKFTLAELNVIAEKRQRHELLLLIQRYASTGCHRARDEL